MSSMVLRCPSCDIQMNVTVPDGVSEAFDKGYTEGINLVTEVFTEMLPLDHYKNEVEKSKVLIQDLAEFLEEDIGEVKLKTSFPEGRLAEEWVKKVDTETFYRDNKDYLYDNIKYNQFPRYHIERLLPLALMYHVKILDIGCGIGMLAFMLSAENEVTGYDINQKVIDFCNFRKSKYNSDVEFTTEEPDYGQFDLITAIGTLEHIENLEAFIRKLGGTMKQGALLYHYDDFGDQNISPMHFNHSNEINGWLEEAGFKILTGRWAIKDANI
uniref:Putative methyltransferase n=1 Tax=viral metagenome TaxID=1070528 RepID=A0A6M3IVG5_9ZZZZ